MGFQPSRRDLVLAGAAISVAGDRAYAGLPPASETQPSRLASGTVRELLTDPSGATKKAPVGGVLVSNGREVVQTDANGRFGLPVEAGQSIFVIKPAGYRVPVDPVTQLPRFSYVYDPDGTPAALGFRYGGMTPTGPLPNSIDFDLVRAPEPDRFDVLMMTDPQPETAAEIAFIRDDVVSGLLGTDAAFGINCGDIAFNDLSMYGRINKIIGRIGVPFWNVGGNHDLDYEAPDAGRSRDTFKRVFGAPYYAHAYGKALFIMLDNVDYAGDGRRKRDGGPCHRGFVSQEQLTFVENLLRVTPRDRLIVLVMHIPLKTYLGDDPAQMTVNAADLLRLIGDRPAVSFAGHTHSTEHHYFGSADGFGGAVPHHHHVLTAASGAWWSGPRDHRGIPAADSYDGTPNGFHVLSVDGTTYTTRFVAKGEPVGRQMRICLETKACRDGAKAELAIPMIELLRSPISCQQAAETRLVVNVFDGGPKTRVECTIGDNEPFALSRVSRPDPFFIQVFERHRATIKEWVEPQSCSHLWEAALPADLDAGTYTVHVAATDEYGRSRSDRMILEIR